MPRPRTATPRANSPRCRGRSRPPRRPAPRRRVRGEGAALRVVAIDGLDQPEPGDLLEVLGRLATTTVTAGQPVGEGQRPGHEVPRSRTRAAGSAAPNARIYSVAAVSRSSKGWMSSMRDTRRSLRHGTEPALTYEPLTLTRELLVPEAPAGKPSERALRYLESGPPDRFTVLPAGISKPALAEQERGLCRSLAVISAPRCRLPRERVRTDVPRTTHALRSADSQLHGRHPRRRSRRAGRTVRPTTGASVTPPKRVGCVTT